MMLASPLLTDRKLLDFKRQGPAASHGIDFTRLDQQDNISIKSRSRIEFSMKQTAYRYLLRCLDLNINYADGFEQFFQFQGWGTLNAMK